MSLASTYPVCYITQNYDFLANKPLSRANSLNEVGQRRLFMPRCSLAILESSQESLEARNLLVCQHFKVTANSLSDTLAPI